MRIVLAFAVTLVACSKEPKPRPAEDAHEVEDPAELAASLDARCVAGDIDA